VGGALFAKEAPAYFVMDGVKTECLFFECSEKTKSFTTRTTYSMNYIAMDGTFKTIEDLVASKVTEMTFGTRVIKYLDHLPAKSKYENSDGFFLQLADGPMELYFEYTLDRESDYMIFNDLFSFSTKAVVITESKDRIVLSHKGKQAEKELMPLLTKNPQFASMYKLDYDFENLGPMITLYNNLAAKRDKHHTGCWLVKASGDTVFCLAFKFVRYDDSPVKKIQYWDMQGNFIEDEDKKSIAGNTCFKACGFIYDRISPNDNNKEVFIYRCIDGEVKRNVVRIVLLNGQSKTEFYYSMVTFGKESPQRLTSLIVGKDFNKMILPRMKSCKTFKQIPLDAANKCFAYSDAVTACYNYYCGE
jgi:hypothetical protein